MSTVSGNVRNAIPADSSLIAEHPRLATGFPASEREWVAGRLAAFRARSGSSRDRLATWAAMTTSER
ncbi:hypothetical protein ACIA8G_12710 [Lentzea sp. NPDC051213]|uniref:hypothetical protein n=1 Tax=Lentzea sp. NPDC051213 TaxID=3364126 RepID=UPI0037B06D1C